MSQSGWKRLVGDNRWFRGAGKYPITAYSEFMPPPRLGAKPYGVPDQVLFDEADLFGWHITEYEESYELQPGLRDLAKHLIGSLQKMGRGESAHGIPHVFLRDNPYWPAEVSTNRAGKETTKEKNSGKANEPKKGPGGHVPHAPAHERYVTLLPLALSRTQDDKGRVRWTLFGGSEQGPSRAFWRSFYSSPTEERPQEWALNFFRRLLSAAYGLKLEEVQNLHQAGFRILAEDQDPAIPHWHTDPLPSWTTDFRWEKGNSLGKVKYLLTFQPYAKLPKPVREAYQKGALHLLPFPGSLLFFGAVPHLGLNAELPFALQIPLLHLIERHEAPGGLRVPQSGWMHEPNPDHPTPHHEHGAIRNGFTRTNRWARVHRHDDEVKLTAQEDKVAHVLFSTAADHLGLYGKPMARNAQIWTTDYQLLLDGPRATRKDLQLAAEQIAAGGQFGYRFVYPAMRVMRQEIYWQRPLVAYLAPDTNLPTVLPDAPLGYLTAYPVDKPRLETPLELWPRLLSRGTHRTNVAVFDYEHDARYHRTAINVRKLLDTWQTFENQPLEASFARQLLTLPKHESLEDWLASLATRSTNDTAAHLLSDTLRNCLAPPVATTETKILTSLTYRHTSQRSFETRYWDMIAALATGEWVNKDNADCVLDPATKAKLPHDHRDLEALGDFILAYYEKIVVQEKMRGKALVGELPFQWKTDFDYHWQGGWANNQQQTTHERDLVVVIPGKDRSRAVIMADHYDTAYMEDVYGYGHGGGGARLSAAGADDNHSATAAMMLAAPIFMELSRAGKLACDIWLVHLTGEEFPADCLGARHLCERLVEGNLKLELRSGRQHDLSKVRVQGVYVSDMIAHNNDHDRDLFQICPGASRESLWLAYQAHVANRTWNQLAPAWNRRAGRKDKTRGQRCTDGHTIPNVAKHLELSGEVRPHYDPKSVLYNTDGQIFSDAGVPVVLFMENYDINRKGYHDTHDTLENIDLDYGAALAAIVIESVARAATETPPQ